MSQENVDALRAVYKDWGKGEFRSVVDLLDGHFLLILRPEFPEAGRYLGVEGLGDYFRDFLSAWETVKITAEEFIEAFARYAVRWHGRFCSEAKRLTAEEAQLALAAALSLVGPGRSAGVEALSELCERHGFKDAADVLEEWAGT